MQISQKPNKFNKNNFDERKKSLNNFEKKNKQKYSDNHKSYVLKAKFIKDINLSKNINKSHFLENSIIKYNKRKISNLKSLFKKIPFTNLSNKEHIHKIRREFLNEMPNIEPKQLFQIKNKGKILTKIEN